MSYRYVVLGAGRQGVALAYDLARNGEAASVVLADANKKVAERAAKRVRKLLDKGAEVELEAVECNAAKHKSVLRAIDGCDVALSAVPYKLNPDLAKWAVEAGCSFNDLGGNTEVVRAELKLDKKATKAGVSIVPDCGLAPGLGNHLAAHGVATMDEPQHVHVRCGGLPERPIGPLGYKMLFNFYGLWNEYRGRGECLRDGERDSIPTLTEIEEIDFGAPLGVLEAAVTSGGTSTCPDTWLGRLMTYDYKTLRYPGHWEKIRTLFALGFMDQEFTAPDGEEFEPVRLTQRLFEDKLVYDDVRDVTVLRVTVIGRHGGQPATRRYDYLEHYDDVTGFTAMERGTAFPTALVAHLQARKLVAPGARPLEISVPAERYFDELPRHDVEVTLTAS